MNTPIALTITTRNSVAYEVFANGQRIAATKGFASADFYVNGSQVIKLPASQEVLIAIHCFSGKNDVRHYYPIEDVEVGQYEALNNSNELDRITGFFGGFLLDVAISCAFFACVPFGVLLFFAQRNHREYLWLAILCLILVLSDMSRVAIYSGWVPASVTLITFRNLFSTAVRISCLEFVAELAGVRRRTWIRILQGFIFLNFVGFNVAVNFENERLMSSFRLSTGIEVASVVCAVGYMLGSAFRRGRKECGIFLVPIILLPLTELSLFVQLEFPKLVGNVWFGSIGWLGFTYYQLGAMTLLVGLVGIVLYRFIRVSKDEEIAASELQAARSVQQLLIPETQPKTAGFVVESAYIPARQVGGDFFLIMPAPEGSDDMSLLAVMGDVSGKGLQAAMVVSTIIGGLRMGFVQQPAEVLKYLNRMLVGHISGFATCCAVLIEPNGRAIIANAGNPSPYSGGEEIQTLPGLPLGMVSEISYEETHFVLKEGQQLTFVSDGVIEATKATSKELFGFDRTLAISEEAARSIAEAACAFGAGAPQADDITVLTIRLL